MREGTKGVKNVILVDIDHVISDAYWRDDLIKRSRDSGNWDEYHGRGKDDKPISDMVELIRLLAAGIRDTTSYGDPDTIELWGITARPEKWRKQSMDWFVKHDVPLDVVLMRPEDQFKPAPQIKLDLCKEHKILERILCIFDDREDVVEAFKAIGVTAFHVHARRN